MEDPKIPPPMKGVEENEGVYKRGRRSYVVQIIQGVLRNKLDVKWRGIFRL